MNNKGQTLVVFIILLPVVCVLGAYIFDKCYLLYQKNNLTDIADIVCHYALDENKTDSKIRQLALENDNDIDDVKINRSDDEVQITLKKTQKSLFSKLIGQENYQIKIKTNCIE